MAAAEIPPADLKRSGWGSAEPDTPPGTPTPRGAPARPPGPPPTGDARAVRGWGQGCCTHGCAAAPPTLLQGERATHGGVMQGVPTDPHACDPRGPSPAPASAGKPRHCRAPHHLHGPSVPGGTRGRSWGSSPQLQAGLWGRPLAVPIELGRRGQGLQQMFVPYGNSARRLPSIGTGSAPGLRGPAGHRPPRRPPPSFPRDPARQQSPDPLGAWMGLGCRCHRGAAGTGTGRSESRRGVGSAAAASVSPSGRPGRRAVSN